MATYYSDHYFQNASGAYVANPVKMVPDASGIGVLPIANLTTALAANDIINMVPIGPVASGKNATVTGVTLDCDAMDTGGTPTLSLDIGDTGSATRYFSAVTTCRAGGYSIPTIPAVLGYQYSAADTVQIKCHAGPQTWANGKVRLLFEYTFDP